MIVAAMAALDATGRPGAMAAPTRSRSHLAPILAMALAEGSAGKPRIVAMAGTTRGFRLLDSFAHVAPLPGSLGTMLGMIDASGALQAAGDAVDPSGRAGSVRWRCCRRRQGWRWRCRARWR